MIQKYSKWKLFRVFAENPSKSFHVRELSREVVLATTSVNLHLKELKKEKLIMREDYGLYPSYKANINNDNFRFYKKMYNLISLKESNLIDELENKLFPTAIILFGSYMKGEDLETSDIDLFLIAKEKEIDLKKYEKQLKRKIQLFFCTDINKMPPEFKNNILNGVVLQGFLKVFI